MEGTYGKFQRRRRDSLEYFNLDECGSRFWISAVSSSRLDMAWPPALVERSYGPWVGGTGSSSDNRLPIRPQLIALRPYNMANQATPGSNSNYSPAPSPADSYGGQSFGLADTHQDRRVSATGRDILPRSPPRPQHAATLSSPTSANGPSRPGGGPASMNHVVPPRPKPGRKPATGQPETKRKAQNRASQRNFRERKQKNTQMLLEQVALAKQQIQDNENKYLRRIQELEEQLRVSYDLGYRTASELFAEPLRQKDEAVIMWKGLYYKERAGDHVSPPPDAPLQSTQSGCDRCTPEHCACLADLTHDMRLPNEASAPMDGISGHGELDHDKHPHVEFEVDFTNKFRTVASSGQQHPSAFAPSMEENKITDCGFCEGRKDICLCDPPARVDSADEAVSPTRMTSGSSAEEVKSNKAMTGPGSCADCQSNPQQRAWCQRVAQLRSEETPSSSRRNSSKSSSLDIMEPKASTSIDMSAGMSSPVGSGRTVGCSDAFKLLNGRVSTDPNAMDWRQLKPVPQALGRQDARRDTFTMEPGMYSAMELDASSILTTLQHAQRPLRPRPSDGPHAPLIEEAEERRRASFSPMTKAEDHAMMDAVSHYNIGP